MTESRAQDYLQGRLLLGSTSPVKSVTKEGNTRKIRLENGTVINTNKQGLTSRLYAVMSKEQKARALRSIRSFSGVVKATIGGSVKGERRTYKTQAAARAAITRKYGK